MAGPFGDGCREGETIDVSQRGTESRPPRKRHQASCRHRHERHEPSQIEGRAGEAKEPVDLREAPQLHFPFCSPASGRFPSRTHATSVSNALRV